MKKGKSYIYFSIIIVVAIVLDLVTKIIFQNHFANGAEDIVVIPNFFNFTYVQNYGAAYGMFSNSTIALTIVSIVLIIVFVIYDIFCHSNNWFYLFGIGFILGGAVGNLIDRLFLGFVRDFIQIRLFSFVFNLADLFITLGVIFFAIHMIISAIKEAKEGKNDKVDNSK